MSYCRWSSDDFQCDVYVYEHHNCGWLIHVASSRVIYDKPLPPPVDLPRPFTDEQFEAWWQRHQFVLRMVEQADRTPIGLLYDGVTFNDETPGECAERLVMLRGLGYRVPQYALDELREEQGELNKENNEAPQGATQHGNEAHGRSANTD